MTKHLRNSTQEPHLNKNDLHVLTALFDMSLRLLTKPGPFMANDNGV